MFILHFQNHPPRTKNWRIYFENFLITQWSPQPLVDLNLSQTNFVILSDLNNYQSYTKHPFPCNPKLPFRAYKTHFWPKQTLHGLCSYFNFKMAKKSILSPKWPKVRKQTNIKFRFYIFKVPYLDTTVNTSKTDHPTF